MAEIDQSPGVRGGVGQRVLALPQHAAGGRSQQAGQHPQQRRFAGSVRPNQDQRTAGGDGEVQVPEHQPLAPECRHAIRLQHAARLSFAPWRQVDPAPAAGSCGRSGDGVVKAASPNHFCDGPAVNHGGADTTRGVLEQGRTGDDSDRTGQPEDAPHPHRGGKPYEYFSLPEAASHLGDMSRLPVSLKVLLENVLRFEDGAI